MFAEAGSDYPLGKYASPGRRIVCFTCLTIWRFLFEGVGSSISTEKSVRCSKAQGFSEGLTLAFALVFSIGGPGELDIYTRISEESASSRLLRGVYLDSRVGCRDCFGSSL